MSIDHRQLTALSANALFQGCTFTFSDVGNDGRRAYVLQSSAGVAIWRLRATDAEWAAIAHLINPPDVTPPNTTISLSHASATDTNIGVTLTATESGTFEYRVDGGAWIKTPAAFTLTLTVGTHTIDARATDAAGNVDQTPATATVTIQPPPPAASALIGVNAPWWASSPAHPQAQAQFNTVAPKIVRDPKHVRAAWDYAATKGSKMLPLFEGTDISALSWMATHPAFCGVVELSNEPFWNGISASSWVSTWGPVIDSIKKSYPSTKMLAPIDDWPTARTSGPGTIAWMNQLLTARPSLATDIYGWAIHPYGDTGPSQALSHLQNGIDALKSHGIAPRMWVTEFGWSRYNTSEANQAAYAQTFINSAKSLCDAIIWYQMNDLSGTGREQEFGLFKLNADDSWDSVWTPAQVMSVIKTAAAG